MKSIKLKKILVWHFPGKLSEDSLEEGSAVAGVAPRQFKSKLEEALTAKQEADAKVTTLESKVQAYEVELRDLKDKVGEHKIWRKKVS